MGVHERIPNRRIFSQLVILIRRSKFIKTSFINKIGLRPTRWNARLPWEMFYLAFFWNMLSNDITCVSISEDFGNTRLSIVLCHSFPTVPSNFRYNILSLYQSNDIVAYAPLWRWFLNASVTVSPFLSINGTIQPCLENRSNTMRRYLWPLFHLLNCYISTRSDHQILSIPFTTTNAPPSKVTLYGFM